MLFPKRKRISLETIISIMFEVLVIGMVIAAIVYFFVLLIQGFDFTSPLFDTNFLKGLRD